MEGRTEEPISASGAATGEPDASFLLRILLRILDWAGPATLPVSPRQVVEAGCQYILQSRGTGREECFAKFGFLDSKDPRLRREEKQSTTFHLEGRTRDLSFWSVDGL